MCLLPVGVASEGSTIAKLKLRGTGIQVWAGRSKGHGNCGNGESMRQERHLRELCVVLCCWCSDARNGRLAVASNVVVCCSMRSAGCRPLGRWSCCLPTLLPVSIKALLLQPSHFIY